MPTPPIFTLILDDITFDGHLPHYPSLIGDELAESLQLEPGLKGPVGEEATGPFEIVFALDPTGPVRFKLEEGELILRHIDDSVVEDPQWIATASGTGLVVVLRWDGSSQPSTTVLRLDCTPDGPNDQPRHLFFVFIDPTSSQTRALPPQTPAPSIPPSPSTFNIVDENGDAVYEVFLSSARAQLSAGFKFDLALRVPLQMPEEEPLQFAVALDVSDMQFSAATAGSDQVPVLIYGGEANTDALLPTLRPNPQHCIVTWNTHDHAPPEGHFLAFNLGTEHTSQSASTSNQEKSMPITPRRVDPTVIVDPFQSPDSLKPST